MTILHIDSSARTQSSVSRNLSARIIAQLGGGDVIRRDLTESLPLIDEAWIGSAWTPKDERDLVQRDKLSLSETLIAELRAADTIVIGAPIYNFSVPAALKAWIDLVARAGETFKYTETGPVGLLEGKRAILAIASGGTAVGSDIDFASGYLKHIMGFIGIHDVEIIAADRVMAQGDQAIAEANAQIDKLAA
ncbi:NAD(P)H-dependent oxidoreductase [uncultured Tateyamaria sp.]|uniref:FMN-dependent NADH-azoreductase n=1 Tax=uncultured Tateyamaria sp. TaxID=455651 RepID=UPI00261C4DFF|nr:NAD(P)H-dependent oxidoreductase [uncultured Tateyamaria sp.]